MWNPSLTSLRNVEEDEAGRLKAFREKFGRGWDVEGAEEDTGDAGAEGHEGDRDESLMDLISGYTSAQPGPPKGVREEKSRSGKGKGGEK